MSGESISRKVTCADVGPDGCVSPPLNNPFNGTVIFECSDNCTLKVCAEHQIVHGNIENHGCNVIFLGSLSVDGLIGDVSSIQVLGQLNP